MLRFQPHVVFWCLGANSITKDSSPGEHVKAVLDYVEELTKSGVKKVYVCEISERGDFSKSEGLTKEVLINRFTVDKQQLWVYKPRA